MNHRVGYFLGNLLFPRRCPYCGRVVGFAPGCTVCEEKLAGIRLAPQALHPDALHAPSLVGITACYFYAMPVKNGVRRMKFSGVRTNALPYGREMARQVELAFAGERFDAMIPVPATKKELRRRGYNVPTLLCQSMETALAIPLQNGILIKECETLRQHDLPVQARRANLLGAFGVAAPDRIHGKTLLLVDDVVTTGSTLEECARMLLCSGAAKVYAAVFAASEKIPNITKAPALTADDQQ